MWSAGWRERTWAQLEGPWDILVIGGGITGAGILREGTRLGLRVLLVEGHDFAWGTSSRSSKLVHGGLRYLKEGHVMLTRKSVQERKRLLDEGPGLIDPLGFLLATYKGDRPGRRSYRAGLSIYDLLALQWSHRSYSAADFQLLAPYIAADGLQGGFHYGDAQTDDARLVLRVIQESVADGGTALNYVAAETLLRNGDGRVTGVRLSDRAGEGSRPASNERTAEVYARVVINATGAWADQLRAQAGGTPRLRPLRGSHLIFPAWRLPIAQAITFLHPVDRRPVFIFPWEGITLVGTTDVDHEESLDAEPRISASEVAYLMAAVEAQFPSLGLTLDDVVATLSGVRPVVGTGQADPSKESRDHVIWEEAGLLTVTGGKLTTFRRIAQDTLAAARQQLPDIGKPDRKQPALNPVDVRLPGAEELAEEQRRRLLGRYAGDAPALVAAAQAGELETIPCTQVLWAELRWAARAEAVLHLDDLLLRRVRLGLLLPGGGEAILPRVRAICQRELGWDDARWGQEVAAYRKLWHDCYSLPDPAAVPDWRAWMAEATRKRQASRRTRRRHVIQGSVFAGTLASLALTVGLISARRLRRRGGKRS